MHSLPDGFEPKKATLTELRTQLEVARERLIHKEAEVVRLRRELENTCIELRQRSIKLNEALDKQHKLSTQLEVTKETLKHTEESFNQKEDDINRKKSSAKLKAFFAILLFLFATLLSSFGTNMLTSSPPDAKGYIFIVSACIAYVLAAIMTIYILGEK